jgi:rare lipoprotein A
MKPNSKSEILGLLGLFVLILCAAICCKAKDAIEAVRSRRGMASWYGESYRGRLMANGKPFDPDALTCATWDYAIGAVLLVTRGDREVLVVVTDRGPDFDLVDKGRVIDLSRAAFSMIADPKDGLVEVTICRAD